MGTKSLTTWQRVALFALAFMALTAYACGLMPAKAKALPSTTYNVHYNFMNGKSFAATGTPGSKLQLPLDPGTNGSKVFLGWKVAGEHNSDFFNVNGIFEERYDAKSNAPLSALPGFGFVNYTLQEDTTATAQWATPRTAEIGKTYQAMLAEDSPFYHYAPTALYTANLTAGKTYYIQSWLPGGDAYLYLLDKDMKYIDSDDDDGEDYDKGFDSYGYLNDYGSYLEFTPTTSGTYYFCSSAYNNDTYDAGMNFFRIGNEKLIEPRAEVAWISQSKNIATTYAFPGELLNQPAQPKRKGYTFAGWFRNMSFNTKVDLSTYRMPTGDINMFAKWTSNDAHIKAFKKTNGYFTQKVTTTNYINRLKISKNKPSVTVKPVKCDSKSTVYMRTAGNKWAKVNSLKVKVAKGKTRTLYVKCVSETGSKYSKTYKIFVTRNK